MSLKGDEMTIKGKKIRLKKKFKKIFFFSLFLLFYIYFLNGLEKINLDLKNSYFYKFLITNSSSVANNDNLNQGKIEKIYNSFIKHNLMDSNYVYLEVPNNQDNNDKLASNDDDNKKPPVIVNTKPIVYIYNTHQTEKYSSDKLTQYSIPPNITIASYMLQEELKKYGIYSYVEEDSVSSILKKNNWKYASSYKVTKEFMTKRQKEMPSLKYFIDLHRDSVARKYTTTQIGTKNYAKLMLLVGLDHKNYQVNLKEANTINNMIKKKYPSLTRGIYKKSGSGVNGIYNQDFSKYTFLFEVGGTGNEIEEVDNTINILAEVLSEYIKAEEGR